jgi:site-specific recombinase XerD
MKVRTERPSLGPLLQKFFCEWLVAQRDVSPRTVASYRDTFRLLLRYAHRHTGRSPTALSLADIDERLVLGFLDHLEKDRRNSPRSRNVRLVAIRSFLHFASYRDPAALQSIQRALRIPMKRFERPLLGFLSRDEMDAVVAAPDRSTWSGRRDHAMFSAFYNTGARVSEVVAIKVGDVDLGRQPRVRVHGKGRKERAVPLWKPTAALLTDWLRDTRRDLDAPLFPNRAGEQMSRAGVEDRLRIAVAKASASFPSLRGRRISPHTIRHTTAMHLLQAGVDLTVVAMWLGHESPSTTHGYVEADLAMKERALNKMQPPKNRRRRFRASDDLLTFLDSL